MPKYTQPSLFGSALNFFPRRKADVARRSKAVKWNKEFYRTRSVKKGKEPAPMGIVNLANWASTRKTRSKRKAL